MGTGRDPVCERVSIVAADNATSRGRDLRVAEIQSTPYRIAGCGTADSVCESGIPGHTVRLRAPGDRVRCTEAGRLETHAQSQTTNSVLQRVERHLFTSSGNDSKQLASAGVVLVSADTRDSVLRRLRSVAGRAERLAVQRL